VKNVFLPYPEPFVAEGKCSDFAKPLNAQRGLARRVNAFLPQVVAVELFDIRALLLCFSLRKLPQQPQSWFAVSKETRCQRLAPHRRSSPLRHRNLRRTRSPSWASFRKSLPTRPAPRPPIPHQSTRHRHLHWPGEPLISRLLPPPRSQAATHPITQAQSSRNESVQWERTRRMVGSHLSVHQVW
jgi:hypothetical protein